jgi:hypothetical protein
MLMAGTVNAQTVNLCYGQVPNAFTNDASPTGGVGPFAYLWQSSTDNSTWVSAPGINNAINYTPTVALTDTTYYRRLVIDQNCMDTAASNSITIIVPDSITVGSALTQVSCNGTADGVIDLTVTGGAASYTYLWSTGATTEDVSGLAAGTYTVTVTDGFNCTKVRSFTITQPTILTASSIVDSNVTCNALLDGGATASATGGTLPYTYSWSNTATTASITGVGAGTYSVTITDANGCTDSSSVVIAEPAALVAATVLDSNVTCNTFLDGGATASATGGTLPYTYNWSNTATTASITGVGAGTYSVTITDANGCTSNSSITITEPVALVSTAAIDSNVTCNTLLDGGATASATGGTLPYTYNWSNTATTASITGVGAGTYSVTITDANGCTDSSSVTITEPVTLVSSSTVDSNITCNGLSDGGATASSTGGTMPYTYNWNNSATTASITGIAAGTYSVTVTDANGCTDSSSVTITEPAVLVATGTPVNVGCPGEADGEANLSVTGGTPTYGYLWSNGSTNQNATGLAAGTYSVTVTDANGCTANETVTITQPAPLTGGSIIPN